MPNTKEKRLTYKQSIDGYTDVGLCEGVTIDEAICKLADYEDAEYIAKKRRVTMDVREKLVELLFKCGIIGSYSDVERIANWLIKDGVTVQEWISVKDRLPDCADTVLAVDLDGTMSTAYYVGYWHGGGDLDEYSVTHWMPLPEPPKGE